MNSEAVAQRIGEMRGRGEQCSAWKEGSRSPFQPFFSLPLLQALVEAAARKCETHTCIRTHTNQFQICFVPLCEVVSLLFFFNSTQIWCNHWSLFAVVVVVVVGIVSFERF